MSKLTEIIKFEFGINNLAELRKIRSAPVLSTLYEPVGFGIKNLLNYSELLFLVSAFLSDIPSGEYKHALQNLSLVGMAEGVKWLLPESPFMDYLRDKYFGWRYRKFHI